MRYKTLGMTGLRVSEMALGTWGIGGAGWDDKPVEERQDAIKAAVECGINFIDTAPAYNAGMAEKHVGQVLHDLGVDSMTYYAIFSTASERFGVQIAMDAARPLFTPRDFAAAVLAERGGQT